MDALTKVFALIGVTVTICVVLFLLLTVCNVLLTLKEMKDYESRRSKKDSDER